MFVRCNKLVIGMTLAAPSLALVAGEGFRSVEFEQRKKALEEQIKHKKNTFVAELAEYNKLVEEDKEWEVAIASLQKQKAQLKAQKTTKNPG
jgi:hypothetical protein